MIPTAQTASPARIRSASIGLVFGGVLWGLFWLPVRLLAQAGFEGAWPGLMIYIGASVLLVPVIVWRWRGIRAHLPTLALCGLLTGTAFSLYSTSIPLTEVVRVLLLFYLMPIWGTLLGLIFLGERLTLARVAALVLGFSGLAVVLGFDAGFPLPRNWGDWLALLSGVAWALGSMALYRAETVPVPEQLVAFVVGSLVVTGLMLWLGGPVMGQVPDRALLVGTLPAAILLGFYILPLLFLTIWPATLLLPGRVGILLMSDVVVGVASAAAFAGEPFGAREIFGTILIVGAALVELLGREDES